MSAELLTPKAFGRDVLGPMVAEFCLRLWSLGSLVEDRDNVAFLFCARGGLRMQLAYERFLASAGFDSPIHVAPLMVSRVAAIRPALMRTVDGYCHGLVPSVAATLGFEFSRSSMAEVALAVSGVPPTRSTGPWAEPLTADGFVTLLRQADAQPVVEALRGQSELFSRHLHDALGDRSHAVLVDTGLFGTTRQLLSDGLPDIDFSSALIARTYRPGPSSGRAKSYGLQVDATGYSPLRRRTAILRYWHFVEWLFEPELASVRVFTDVDGVPRSNLQVEGWREQVLPTPDSAFDGVIEYLDRLPRAPAARVVLDADRAWTEFRRALVWPNRGHGHALTVGMRSHDFGTDGTWSARPWSGPVAALRGSTMWREGEIARSGSALRLPLLAVIEAAYGVRLVGRKVARLRQ